MKKFLSMLLVLVLTLSMGTVAFAEETPTDMGTVTITKNYNATNTGTTSPAEEFKFKISATSVTDASAGVTVENMPVPTIDTVSYSDGDAGKEGSMSKQITVTLPTYTSVGIYTYTIKETAGTTAGVTYYGEDIKLVVTVIQQDDGKIRVAAVHTEGADVTAKSDNFPNEYSAGSLAVSKTVTGNMGDQSKEFDVTVTFTAPEGKTVNSVITYTDGDVSKSIVPASSTATGDSVTKWTENNKATVKISLKHNETVTFANIPYGVTYTVEESDYTSEENGGYDTAAYNYSDEANKKIDSASDTVTITNSKGVEVDMGIGLDSLPYILLLAFVVIGLTVFFVKRRTAREN